MTTIHYFVYEELDSASITLVILKKLVKIHDIKWFLDTLNPLVIILKYSKFYTIFTFFLENANNCRY